MWGDGGGGFETVNYAMLKWNPGGKKKTEK